MFKGLILLIVTLKLVVVIVREDRSHQTEDLEKSFSSFICYGFWNIGKHIHSSNASGFLASIFFHLVPLQREYEWTEFLYGVSLSKNSIVFFVFVFDGAKIQTLFEN